MCSLRRERLPSRPRPYVDVILPSKKVVLPSTDEWPSKAMSTTQFWSPGTRVTDNASMLPIWETIARWAALLWSPRGDTPREQELLPDFLTDVLCRVVIDAIDEADAPIAFSERTETGTE